MLRFLINEKYHGIYINISFDEKRKIEIDCFSFYIDKSLILFQAM